MSNENKQSWHWFVSARTENKAHYVYCPVFEHINYIIPASLYHPPKILDTSHDKWNIVAANKLRFCWLRVTDVQLGSWLSSHREPKFAWGQKLKVQGTFAVTAKSVKTCFVFNNLDVDRLIFPVIFLFRFMLIFCFNQKTYLLDHWFHIPFRILCEWKSCRVLFIRTNREREALFIRRN